MVQPASKGLPTCFFPIFSNSAVRLLYAFAFCGSTSIHALYAVTASSFLSTFFSNAVRFLCAFPHCGFALIAAYPVP